MNKQPLNTHPMKTQSSLPLAGLKVLELGHIVAGPTAGQILADMGADVTKIESIEGGDQARNMPGAMTAMFHFLNRNKQSIALDLKGEGKDIFLKMAATADVVIDNFAYGAIDRLGIGYEEVSKSHPRLSWLPIKGFLPGPMESQPMLDELAQMGGGLAFMTGLPDRPMRAGASVIDVGAASYGIIAVLAALRQRDMGDGCGQYITAGLYETSVYWVAQWMATAQFSGEPSVPVPTIQQGTRMGFGIYRLFETAEGSSVFVGVISNAHWQRFCKAFALDALYADTRFIDNAGRVGHRQELNDAVAAIFRQHTLEDAVRKLQEANIPFTPLRRPDQLGDDAHLNDSGQLVDTPLPNGKTGRLPKLPFRATGFDMPIRSSAPVLGADTRAILRKLGYSDADIDALAQRGAIVAPAAQEG